MMIKCTRCNGTGQIEEGSTFTGSSTQCKKCGFQAIGKRTVQRFEKNGGLCSDCSGDYSWI